MLGKWEHPAKMEGSSPFIVASLDGVIAIADNKLDYSLLDSSQFKL